MLRPSGLALAALVAVACVACSRTPVDEPRESPRAAAPAPPKPAPLSARLSRPAPARVVAIGDLHGDLDHARRALRLAGAVDAQDKWVGGALVVVQTGDEVDRGDDDRTILDLVESLKTQ